MHPRARRGISAGPSPSPSRNSRVHHRTCLLMPIGVMGYGAAMGHPLDLVHLRSLVAIADTGGFGRAAATLHVSQSTVSQHIRLLEKRVGGPVVERVGRSTRFTATGERLLVEARRILAVHDDALDRLDALTGTALVIGSTETAAEQVLPTLLAEPRSAFPERRARFHIDRSTQMVDAVTRGTIDLAPARGRRPRARQARGRQPGGLGQRPPRLRDDRRRRAGRRAAAGNRPGRGDQRQHRLWRRRPL